MYKNIQYGNSTDDYDIKDLYTGLHRVELAANFFIPIPGPKMIWQFGELGYDYSINYCEDGTIDEQCRTYPKPIEWGYTQEWQRSQLFNLYKELISLKQTYPVFSTGDFNLNVAGYQKSIELFDDEMNVAVLGNFATTEETMTFGFLHGGYWYEYFSGDSLLAGDFAPEEIVLSPGEYRLYTDVKISEGISLNIDEENIHIGSLNVFPNPVQDAMTVDLSSLDKGGKELFIYSSNGVLIYTSAIPGGIDQWSWSPESLLASGLYLLRLITKSDEYLTRFVIE